MSKKSKKSGGGDIIDQLEGLDGWNDTPEKSFDDVDPGKYQVRVDGALLNNAKSSGRLQVSWELTILNGDFAGRKLFKHDGIDTEDNRSYFRGSLAKLGHEWPDDPKDLPDLLEDIVESYAMVTVRKRKDGDGVAVYFDKALDIDEIDDETGGTGDADGDASEAGDDLTAADVRGMDKKALKKLAKEQDLEIEDWSDLDDVKDGIIEALELKEIKSTKKPKKGEEAEPEEAGDDELTADDIRDMDKKALKKLVKEKELEIEDWSDLDEVKDEIIGELELEEVGEAAEPAKEEEEEVVCTLTFKDKAIDKVMKKKFTKMAVDAELDPDDYDTVTEMLVELAEYYGISGEFKKPEALMKALSKK